MRLRGLDVTSGVALPGLLALAAVLACGSFGVPADWTIGVVATGAALAVVVALGRLESVGVALLVVGVATSTWNAVAYGPLKITHAALAAAVLILGAVAVGRDRALRVPTWVWILGAAIAATAVLSFVWPPPTAYFAARNIADLPDDVAVGVASLGADNVVAGLKWLVAAVALPAAVCLAVADRPHLVTLLADAWTAGAAVSALVATLDRLGLTAIGVHFVPTDWGGRQVGLSVHPNHLALSLAMVLPLVVWRLARSRDAAHALVPAAAGAVIAVGLVAAGSRAGVAGAALALVLALVVDARARRLVPLLGGLAVACVVVVLAATPSLVSSLGEKLRLVGSDGAVASDELRVGLAEQALADFAHSPLHGIGLEVVAQGHNIHLQLLASGGLVLATGYAVAQLGFLGSAWTVHDDGAGLGRMLAVAGGTFLVVGAVGNQLADVFVAVPFALAAGLWALHDGAPTTDSHPTLEREDITP